MSISLSQQILLEKNRRLNKIKKKEHVLQQLFWECTLRCNLKCLHCGSDCKVDERKPDMPFEDFEKVLDDVANEMDPHGILVITTGGEPLVRKDLAVCGRKITEKGFMWGMVSNGMLLTVDKLNELIACGLNTIAISLDGFEADHNWMRGSSLSFGCAVRAIKALVKSDITWDVITCVNKRNIGRIEEFCEFLYGIGVRQWRIFTIFPAGRAKESTDLLLEPQQLQQVMDFIVQTRTEGKMNLSYSCEGFLGEYERKVRDYQFFCGSGINVASVLCDGSISGCLSIRAKFDQGNIYKDHFTDVWETRFQQYRDHSWMKTGVCADCEAWRWCEGNGMHLRDENGNLPHCYYNTLFHNNKIC